MKKFFYGCVALFLLSLSFYLGARTATAQAPGNPVVTMVAQSNCFWVITSNGDTYFNCNPYGEPWRFIQNVFAGGPTPTRPETWGSLKSRYR